MHMKNKMSGRSKSTINYAQPWSHGYRKTQCNHQESTNPVRYKVSSHHAIMGPTCRRILPPPSCHRERPGGAKLGWRRAAAAGVVADAGGGRHRGSQLVGLGFGASGFMVRGCRSGELHCHDWELLNIKIIFILLFTIFCWISLHQQLGTTKSLGLQQFWMGSNELIFTIFVCNFSYYSVHVLFFLFLPTQGIRHCNKMTTISCIGNYNSLATYLIYCRNFEVRDWTWKIEILFLVQRMRQFDWFSYWVWKPMGSNWMNCCDWTCKIEYFSMVWCLLFERCEVEIFVNVYFC
jgi:hypothetical protein